MLNSVVRKEKSHRSSAELEIRPADFSDMLKIAEMISSTADWYRPIVDAKDMAEHEVGLAWAKRNHRLRDFYVAYANGQAVGTVSLQFFGKWAYLGYVYLDADQVGKGYGRQLLDFAKEQALMNGLDGMVLIAHPDAVWAKRAYLKYGFEIVHKDRESVLAWNNGALKPHYEEGFELYRFKVKPSIYKVEHEVHG